MSVAPVGGVIGVQVDPLKRRMNGECGSVLHGVAAVKPTAITSVDEVPQMSTSFVCVGNVSTTNPLAEERTTRPSETFTVAAPHVIVEVTPLPAANALPSEATHARTMPPIPVPLAAVPLIPSPTM